MMIPARYTEVVYNLVNNPQTKEKIDLAMSSYPLYESINEHEYHSPNIVPTREELNKKILNYYMYREIGFETVGRFLQELEISLNEIMPYYNQLFYSADQDFNIIYNVDYKRTINRDLSGNTSTETSATDSTESSSGTTSNSKHVTSDTPQNQLSITNKQIDSVDYANQVDWNKDDATSSGSTSGESSTSGTGTNRELESTLETTKGNFGVVSAQDLIKKYREIIINIEQQIINDPRIVELFMLVY